MGAQGEFKVTVVTKEMVAPALPSQEHWLTLSNLDLLLPPVDVGVFFCYRQPALASPRFLRMGSVMSVLKDTLAQALVSYYAFAGEVVLNSVGEPELLCNNKGVDFTEAQADVQLKDLNFYDADATIEGKLVPKRKQGVLAVQATELQCGGLVVACTFDHRIADAYSANMFLVAWAEVAHMVPSSVVPSFRRSLISARRPLCLDASLDEMYVPVNLLPKEPSPEAEHADPLISRIYHITAAQLDKLQCLASSNRNKRTKLESFSAFLWKMVARSAQGSGDNKLISKMGVVVDGRSRLEGDLSAYFGNVLSIPFGERNTADLVEEPLSTTADCVHEFLETAVTQEHFLGLIDWVEAHRPVPGLAKIYCRGSEDGPAFVVSSGQRFPVSKVDFGWGRPVFGSYHFPWGGSAGYVMPMPSPLGNGDWVVYVHLPGKQVEAVEEEAGHVLRPLTPDYLGL
ncbi:hypothetical protein MLD38_028519 [Melastoma candidum]|uniref:Uncharacterized protein n=1 Tax=Melastoma candidum TaxID=119954 RepID=A0ACB9N1C3_9MYRT|nr:hypothetical protein MLD38_028519 [Melastoma candidum]